MDANLKYQWSEETQCFLALWSSEVQHKLDGASRTKPVYEKIQRDMTAARHRISDGWRSLLFASQLAAELLALGDEALVHRSPVCSSLAPSCSSCMLSSSSQGVQTLQTLTGKRNHNSSTDLLQYLERSEEWFLEQNRRQRELATAMMDENSSTLVGLMVRMVLVLEMLTKNF